jgi:hypothetical protein
MSLGVIGTSCSQHGREGDSAIAEKQISSPSDSLKKPNVNVTVNRRYDDKGNLIGFDSTYSSYYSTRQGDTLRMESMMRNFGPYAGHNHSGFFGQQFNPLFFNDSLRHPDLFGNDFFIKLYDLDNPYLRGVMRHADSIRTRLYRDARKLSEPEKKS